MITRALAACSCVAVLVTACTSSSGSGPSSASPPPSAASSSVSVTSTSAVSTSTAATSTATSAAPTSTGPATPTTSHAAKPSSTAAAAPRGCTDKQLTVGHSAPGGVTGHSGVVVVFVNDSATTCTLTGYPGAAVLDSGGTQIVQAKRTTSGFLGGCGCSPKTVTLRPGGKASALIEGDVAGGDECLRGRALLVTPPNTKHSTRIAFRAYSCDVEVHPTVAGAGGGKRA